MSAQLIAPGEPRDQSNQVHCDYAHCDFAFVLLKPAYMVAGLSHQRQVNCQLTRFPSVVLAIEEPPRTACLS